MAFSYDINTSKKDNRASACLMISHRTSTIINLFLSTFLVAYIYDFSGGVYDYIFKVGIYEICTYLTLTIMFFVLMRFVEKSNRVWYHRVGLVLRLALVLFAVFFGKQIASLLPIAGFLNGFSFAFYYTSYNTMKQEMVSRKSMNTFVVVSNILGQIVNIIAPIVLGTLIEISTYTQVAIYVVVVCVFQIGLSFGIKSQRPEGSKFDLKDYFQRLKQKPEVFKKMKLIYWINFVYGFTTVISTLVNVCIMMQLGSNLKLGALTSVMAVVSMASILAMNKFTKPGKRAWLFKSLAFIPLILSIIFACHSNSATLIAYNFGTAIINTFYVLFDVYRNSTLKECGLYDCIPEHQSLLEGLLGVARIASYVVMIILGLLNSLVLFKVFLCLIVSSSSILLILLMIYEKKYETSFEISEKASMKIIYRCVKTQI